MNSDWLLLFILPLTVGAAYVKLMRKRRGAFVAYCYMLGVFTMTGLDALHIITLDINTRVLLLRCGWFLIVFDEVVTWVKVNRWSRKEVQENGNKPT